MSSLLCQYTWEPSALHVSADVTALEENVGPSFRKEGNISCGSKRAWGGGSARVAHGVAFCLISGLGLGCFFDNPGR